MLTIGSKPGPGALHLTQGVVRVVVGGVKGFSRSCVPDHA